MAGFFFEAVGKNCRKDQRPKSKEAKQAGCDRGLSAPANYRGIQSFKNGVENGRKDKVENWVLE